MNQTTKEPKQGSKEFIENSLEILTPQRQKKLLKKSSLSGYLIPSEQVKAINNLLSTAYANDQAAKALAAMGKNDFSFLPQQQRALEILEMMWENEKILGHLKDFFEAQTEPFCF